LVTLYPNTEAFFEVVRIALYVKVSGSVRHDLEDLTFRIFDRDRDAFDAKAMLSRLQLGELGGTQDERVHGSPQRELRTIVVDMAPDAILARIHLGTAPLASDPSHLGITNVLGHGLDDLVIASERNERAACAQTQQQAPHGA
jgi:hypothetical protein